MSLEAKIKNLTRAPGYVRTRATKIINELNSQAIDTLDQVSKHRYGAKLEIVQSELVAMNKTLFEHHMDAGTTDDVLDSIVLEEQEYDDNIFDMLHVLRVETSPAGLPQNLLPADSSNIAPSRSRIQIPLPSYYW